MHALPPPAQVQEAPDLGARIQPLLGIPYVDDGAQEADGQWRTFGDPTPRTSQGFNCSGFLVAAARRLLRFRGSLAEASRDRLGDNAKGTLQDWDFGWDLLLNLSEGHARQWLTPEGFRPVQDGGAARERGFAIPDEAAWAPLLGRLRGDRVYFAAFVRPLKHGVQHHHVGLLLREPGGTIHFYQTLPHGRVHRLNLATAAGRCRWGEMFGTRQRLLLMEVKP